MPGWSRWAPSFLTIQPGLNNDGRMFIDAAYRTMVNFLVSAALLAVVLLAMTPPTPAGPVEINTVPSITTGR